MSKKLLFLFLSAVSLLTVSCVRENAGVFGGPSNKVIFSFDSDIPVTKAELSADPAYFDPIDVSKEFGIENLVIEESVSDLSSLYSLYQTRGVPVYTSNFAELYADNLGVTAFHGGALYKPEVAFSNDADSNFWSYEYD